MKRVCVEREMIFWRRLFITTGLFGVILFSRVGVAQDVYNFHFQKQPEAQQPVPEPTPEPLAPSTGREILDEESALANRHLRPWEVTLGVARNNEDARPIGRAAPGMVFGFRYYFTRYFNAQLDFTSPPEESQRETFATASLVVTPVTVTVFGSERLRLGGRYGFSKVQKEVESPVSVGVSVPASRTPVRQVPEPAVVPNRPLKRLETVTAATWGVFAGLDFTDRWTVELSGLIQEGDGIYERSTVVSIGYRL